MKKILVISPFFYPHVGGSERYLEDLYAYTLGKNKNLSVDVLCYNTNRVNSSELYRGMNIYRIPCFNILQDQFSLPSPLSLLNFLLQHKDYDLIHVSTRFFDSAWWAPLFARLIKARIVLTDHCAYHPVAKSRLVSLLVRFFEATIVKLSLRFYDKIFVQNGKTKEFLKDKFSVDSIVSRPGLWGIMPKRSPQRATKVKVIYTGRIIKSKGVEALFNIALKNPEVNIILAGDGPMLETLKKEKDKRKVGNIKFLGNVSRKEVKRLLSDSDIFAYPTFHSEGLPMAILEAGEIGLPVVAMDSGAVSDIIENGKTGILVPTGDEQLFESELIRLSLDKNLREELGKNLREYVLENFSWKKASNLLLKELK